MENKAIPYVGRHHTRRKGIKAHRAMIRSIFRAGLRGEGRPVSREGGLGLPPNIPVALFFFLN